MAAASKRIGRLKRVDRAAVGMITAGGIAVIVAVLGILVFIAAEAVPLFRPASLTPLPRVPGAPAAPGAVAAAPGAFRAFGSDEYRKYLYAIEPDGHLALLDFATGQPVRRLEIPHVGASTVTASSRSLAGGYLAAGTDDGRVILMQVRAVPQYTDQTMTGVALELRDRGVAEIDPAHRAVRQVSSLEDDGRKFVAALVSDREIRWWTIDADGATTVAELHVAEPDRVTQIRLGRGGTLIAGTDRGHVYHWDAQPEMHLTDVSPVSRTPITALEWVLGGNSWIAGTEDGLVSGWFRAPIGESGTTAMVRAHDYEPQGAAVTAIAMSARERSFATVDRDGTVVLRHFTSERTLATLRTDLPVSAAFITPKADSLVLLHPGSVDRIAIANPHPEISLAVLFGKVWYEGYAKPEYVWQSTGATDDVESKFSLIPLLFGTLKGTLYAMLFAVPLAVAAALYTSQFVHGSIRARVKPAVEIMAALPSVVIGFLAGLYLSTVVEKHLVGIGLMMLLLPAAGSSGVLLWRLLPKAVTQRARPGSELILLMPLLVLAAGLSLRLGPGLEAAWFGGDARFWLSQAFGVTYDQRNCLVVGLAMGFAVIPIIFTIADDAFSSVPSSLTAASLALGATRWQTAIRVVLPTASPGVFSAVMVGFGRAVGETMIVLMATGNTPVMEWSIFNGIRTLSANIAVEIPEAPHGGTLYRTLFLTAALLFILTFVVNTVAELVRQRLRERYKAV